MLFPCGKKAFIHLPWRCCPSYGPCEHPFQTEGEKRPSISWLVENIYDWLVPQRLLAGRVPAGEFKTAQNTNDTSSVLVRGYNQEKETDWGMQIASWCWNWDTCTIRKWRLAHCYYHWWIPSGGSTDPAKEDSKKTCIFMWIIAQLWFPACFLPLVTWNLKLISWSTEN